MVFDNKVCQGSAAGALVGEGRGRGVGSSENCCEVGTLKLNWEVWGRDRGPKSFWRGVRRHGACSRVAAHAVTPVDLLCTYAEPTIHVYVYIIKQATVTKESAQAMFALFIGSPGHSRGDAHRYSRSSVGSQFTSTTDDLTIAACLLYGCRPRRCKLRAT